MSIISPKKVKKFSTKKKIKGNIAGITFISELPAAKSKRDNGLKEWKTFCLKTYF